MLVSHLPGEDKIPPEVFATNFLLREIELALMDLHADSPFWSAAFLVNPATAMQTSLATWLSSGDSLLLDQKQCKV